MHLKKVLITAISVLQLLLLAGSSTAQAEVPSAAQARELVEQAAIEYGGKSAWDGKGTLIVQETQTRYSDGATQVIKLRHVMDTRGRGYRLERETAGARQVFGWNGQSFWAVADGTPGDEALLDEARRVITDAFYRFSLPFILADDGVALEYAGTGEVDGVPTEVVKITYQGDPAAGYFQTSQAGHGAGADHGGGHHGGNQVYFYHFDKHHRIVKAYFSHHGDGSYESLYPQDYEPVDGILLESRRLLLRPDGSKLYESRFGGRAFQTRFDPALFSQPHP